MLKEFFYFKKKRNIHCTNVFSYLGFLLTPSVSIKESLNHLFKHGLRVRTYCFNEIYPLEKIEHYVTLCKDLLPVIKRTLNIGCRC